MRSARACYNRGVKRASSIVFVLLGALLAGPLDPLLAGGPGPDAGPDSGPDFAAEIRPLLSRSCFACHGPDEHGRQAGLRLDEREDAIAPRRKGAAIVPGDRAASRLWIRSGDSTDPMPPAGEGHALDPEERELLGRWIDAGAEYAPHWAFVPPKDSPLPSLPDGLDPEWPLDSLDLFVVAKMDEHGLAPSAAADRWTLARRVALDLTGLPPTFAEAEAFVLDERPDAYGRYVDALLASPHYGERWAAVWLDIARYADSKGHGSDPLREIWRYRDWVIEAFQRNLPYDQFLIHQLAGDLLPGATLEQRLATAFHRNTMNNTEGGTDDEEWRVAAVKDRTNTTMQAVMGLTAGCAACHSHKFDPISQHEYYSLTAYFNQTADTDKNDDSPLLDTPTRGQIEERQRLESDLAAAQARWAEAAAEEQGLDAFAASWLDAHTAPSAAGAKDALEFTELRVSLPGAARILSLAEAVLLDTSGGAIAGGHASQSSTGFAGPAELARDGNTSGAYTAGSVTHTLAETGPWWSLRFESPVAARTVRLHNRTDSGLGRRLAGALVEAKGSDGRVLWSAALGDQPADTVELDLLVDANAPEPELLAAAGRSSAERSPADWKLLAELRMAEDPALAPARKAHADLEQKVAGLEIPRTPVMVELPADKQRTTHLLIKGNFLVPGDVVEASVPAALHAWPEGQPHDRLGLARWLTDPQSPLTARVAVNRIWARLFGRGLVTTEEDFGNQGSPPTHPALLDHLALGFQRGGWDQKALIRRLVTSATYRQASNQTPAAGSADPGNRWLSRGPRVRLEAEMVRDVALVASGLFSPTIGGPSIFPPQPEGLWQAAFNGQRSWTESQGPDRYRRGLYVFLRRSIPYPAMDAFDVPNREICNARRIATNTPLQALVTLNDPAFVELAQGLARRMFAAGETAAERAAFGLRETLVRPADPRDVQLVVDLVEAERAAGRSSEESRSLACDPLGPLPDGWDPADLGPWTVAASVLLNQDAVLTKQ